MSEFRAVRANFGYLGTYWRKGESIDVDKAPNEHWVLASEYDRAEAAGSAALNANISKTADAAEKAKTLRSRRKK